MLLKHSIASSHYLDWSQHTSQTFTNNPLLSQGMKFLNLNPTFARIGLSTLSFLENESLGALACYIFVSRIPKTMVQFCRAPLSGLYSLTDMNPNN